MSEKQPFSVQAARFSLYAPLVGIAVNCFARAGTSSMKPEEQRSVGLTIGVIALLLYVTGLGLGIAALATMRSDTRDQVLWRAILGIVFNGLILSAAGYFVLV